MGTKIEWAEEVWNPIVGCSHCSPGCDHCYAERMARRQAAMALKKSPCPDVTKGQGRYVAVIDPDGKWNGATAIDEIEDISGELYKPLRMKRPRRIFVCSMSDLFHKNNPDEWIESICQVQNDAPQHTYLWLTKRPERMRDFIVDYFGKSGPGRGLWCGVTVCNQKEADEKIPILLQVPAEVRFISIEPMLGPVDLYRGGFSFLERLKSPSETQCEKIDWVIVGGESGPGARPMNLDWVRSIRNQCAAAGIPFLFKQWGGWTPHPHESKRGVNTGAGVFVRQDGGFGNQGDWWSGNAQAMDKARGKSAGRMLDGVFHDGYPV